MWALYLLSILLIPVTAFAGAVEIVEVQYDPEGSDKGREWVRIQNTSGAPLDLSGWKFVEGGVNHNLKPVDTAIIPAGGYAIIADNVTQYFAENLNTPDILFDSSFSLSNSGETIALMDTTKALVATKAYVAEQTQVAAAAASQPQKKQAPRTKSQTNEAPQIESDQAAAPLIAAPAAAPGTPLWPWLLGLGALAIVGGAALLLVPSGTKSGYEIIETHD